MFDLARLSRRDFLKLTGVGSLSLAILSLPNLQHKQKPEFEGVYGRVIEDSVTLFDRLSFTGNTVKTCYKDSIFPITDVTLGDQTPSYNRIWYGLNHEGYAHSGIIQPVRVNEDGVAFHGTFWHNDFGKPRSHGCINLSPQAARWIYLWTNPTVPPGKDYVAQSEGTAIHVI
jgi:hypothetical protein